MQVDGLVAVEVAAGQSLVLQGCTWLPGMTVYLPALEVPAMRAAGIVVDVGTYNPPPFSG